MSNLILNSLEIRNFRGFRHLRIEQLGRVNLIVGKNNIGKSSLMEALQLYAHNGNPNILWEILQTRDEGKAYSQQEYPNVESLLRDLRYLFYGRKELGQRIVPIKIGPIDSADDAVFISIGWYVSQRNIEDELPRWHLLKSDEYNSSENPVARFVVKAGKLSRSYSLNQNKLLKNFDIKVDCIAIAPNGLDYKLIGVLWDAIALTELEKHVVEVMRIIAPGIERLSVVGNLDTKDPSMRNIVRRERRVIPIVKVAGIDEPIALRSLGDGMQRVFGLALALVNAKDGMLLIDEIENGLHYSVQPDIWHLVFQLAQQLNIQVFATTHSLDCIKAFQEAARKNTQEEGILIRLQSKNNEISAVLYNEDDLETATQEQIEVR